MSHMNGEVPVLDGIATCPRCQTSVTVDVADGMAINNTCLHYRGVSVTSEGVIAVFSRHMQVTRMGGGG
jgi:hypothetical protein